MLYTTQQIIRDSRIAMGLDLREDPWLSRSECLNADDVIMSRIEAAARQAAQSAESDQLGLGKPLRQEICWQGNAGWLLLPDDFMRLLIFQMSDWHRPVTAAITPASPLYALQSSRFEGLRGCPQRPLCAVVMRPEGLSLEFYSCASQDAAIARAQYAPLPTLRPDGSIEIPELIYPKVIELIAHD